MKQLLDQAARVLDHQPTRSMDAEPLYRKAVRETGCEVPYPQFLTALRGSTDRFAVIEADPLAELDTGWEPRHRSLYRAAVEAAGLGRAVVFLAEGRQDDALDRDVPATPADVLGDVHDALTHLLHSAQDDESMTGAVAAALSELHTLRRYVVPGGLRGDGA